MVTLIKPYTMWTLYPRGCDFWCLVWESTVLNGPQQMMQHLVVPLIFASFRRTKNQGPPVFLFLCIFMYISLAHGNGGQLCVFCGYFHDIVCGRRVFFCILGICVHSWISNGGDR